MATLPLTFAGPPAKWVLIDASLVGEGNDLLLYLVARSPSGQEDRRPIPVTLKGRLREVVRLPFVPASLALQTQYGEAAPRLKAARVQGLNAAHGLALQGLRVWRYFRRLDAAQRKRLGLRAHSAFLDTQAAYQRVSLLRAYCPAPTYAEWRQHCHSVNGQSLRLLQKQHIPADFQMTVVVDAQGGGESASQALPLVEKTRASVRDQLGMPGVGFLVRDGTNEGDHVREALNGLPAHTWVGFAAAGVVFEPWAAAWLAFDSALDQASLLYSDHDITREDGTRDKPFFKPDWSLDLAVVTGYMGQAFWMRAGVWQNLPPEIQAASAYTLFMHAAHAVGEEKVGHVPAILWSAPAAMGDGYARPLRHELENALGLQGRGAAVQTDKHGQWQVLPPLPQPAPLVSVIIPTRNLINMLRPCVESVLTRSNWPNLEVIVVDNQSDCPETLAYLSTLQASGRARVISYDQPFNFSAIVNFAVERAQGSVVCLLNNDTEVISANWLEEMVGRLYHPGVGVVGARLLYADGRLQHGGDVLGAGGCASHMHGPIPGDDPGYMNRAILPQDVSAVTGACLLVRKSLYQELGGFNEKNLPVAFNDVDFCLRVRAAGYRVVYTPYAELHHYESVSRGADVRPEDAARATKEARYMRSTWPHYMASDPFYNPNLNQSRPDMRLGRVRNVMPPWEAA